MSDGGSVCHKPLALADMVDKHHRSKLAEMIHTAILIRPVTEEMNDLIRCVY